MCTGITNHECVERSYIFFLDESVERSYDSSKMNNLLYKIKQVISTVNEKINCEYYVHVL